MNTDGHGVGLPRPEVTFAIIGCAMTVLNELGHGHHEKPYENALTIELLAKGFRIEQQRRFEVRYKGILVGEYIPDLIVDDCVIVDTKVVEKLGDHERGQMLNYLRTTQLRIGLILNFRYAKLTWERLVL